MASKSLASIAAATLMGLTLSLAAPVQPAEAKVHVFLGFPGYGYGYGYGPYYGPNYYDYGYYPRHRYRHHCGWRRVRVTYWRHGHRHKRWVRRRVCW
jgi:hypothetical protein